MSVRSISARARIAALRGLFPLIIGLLAASAAAQTPLPAGPHPVAWFRTDSLHGLTDGAAVAKWPDSVGKNYAVQATAGQQPVYVAHAFGALPGVRFVAQKNTQLYFPRPVQDDFTLVCVYQSAQGLGADGNWALAAGLVNGEVAGSVDDFGVSLSGSGRVLAGTGNPDTTLSSDSGLNDGKPHLVTFTRVKSTGAITLFLDGVQADSGIGGGQTLTSPPRLTLGSLQRNDGYLSGDIGEVQVYAKALSEEERKSVEAALKSRYGIVSTAFIESAPADIPASARLSPVILPPDPKPAIHGPKLIGTTPNHPFLFLIPATGADKLTYACSDLPAGLTLDAQTGVISGAVTLAGSYTLHLSVSNAQGTAARALTLVCGEHAVALTPPMGWDAFNVYANQISDAKTRDAADWLIKSGLAAHGYSFVHVSDTWQGIRNKKTGEILPNHRRFPDMKALGDYLHDRGLKFGLYSSATEHTCAGYPGSRGYENNDAAKYAAWGVDYLEYSWCPLETLDENKPAGDEQGAFRQMHDALGKTGRDIVYAVNTFGNEKPWYWWPTVGGNSWVTTGQIYDDWSIMTRDYFGAPWLSEMAGPGHWINPGLLMVGKFGYPDIHNSHLSPSEQMTQFSQAALLSAPLWLSCDLSSLDPNTFHPSVTALLTNDEVLDVDQDPAGRPAAQVSSTSTQQVWFKSLSDGTTVVGLYNLGSAAQVVKVRMKSLGLSDTQPVRDLWLHRDLGDFAGAFSTEIPAHGVALVKIGNPKD